MNDPHRETQKYIHLTLKDRDMSATQRPEISLKNGSFEMLKIIFDPLRSQAEVEMATSTLMEVINPKYCEREYGKCHELNWDFDDDGEWEAASVITDEGSPFYWRIHMTVGGEFSVHGSDSELGGREETFDSLRDARSWCYEKEWEYFKAASHEEDENPGQ